MSKVMVTGAGGFIGSHLIERLLKDGKEVYAFDIINLNECLNLTEVKKHPNFFYFQGDIRNDEDITKFFQSDASIIYHLASVVGVRYYMQDPLSLIDITINGTRNLIKHCSEKNVKMLFASTSEVYGKNPNTPWNENADRVLGDPSVDRWCYSSSKALIEHMLFSLYRKNILDFSTVRFFNVYGPKQNPIYVVSQSIYRILNNLEPDLYDGGNQVRCFTYIDDAIEGIIRAGTYKKASGEVFNIGNQVPTKIKEILEICMKESGTNININNVSTSKLYGDVYQDIDNRIPDCSKADKILDWNAKIQAKEGIRKTINWIKSNPWYLK